MKKYKRILILGSPGAGKSTFSVKLHTLLNIPLIHLDTIFWQNSSETVSNEAFDEKLREALLKPSWIMDSNFTRTLKWRLEYADIVFILTKPSYLCVYRICKRFLFRKISQEKHGNPNILELDFIRYTWNFNRDKKPF